METPKPMKVEEVARMMRVSRMTVYRIIHEGELEALRIGRSFRIKEESVKRYLEAAGTGVS